MRDVTKILITSLMVCLICAFLVGCGGSSSSSSSSSNTITPPTAANVATISVNGGPLDDYADAAFASVTVCVPATTNCQTIDNVLVDTGSWGLRLLSSALTVPLPQQTAADGNPVSECLTFVASYTWGPVQTADVQMAGEKASSVPIQVLSDAVPAPSGCTSSGFPSADTLDTLYANGILGVGLLAQDCGNPCPASYDQYYECASSTCQPIDQALSQQVTNPVALFASDNNGVIVELPSVSSAGEPSVSGSLVFGIGTQSNNALGSAVVYTPDDYLNFTTSYNGQSYPDSFIDSGSDAYFFLDSSLTGLTNCPSNEAGFYCSSQNFSVTNLGSNGASGVFNFSIANAATLFANENNFAYENLGGYSATSPPYYFDWGLPFFFGQNVFVAIAGASTPGGTGPYWAY
jgi:Protein of unknown function (DUF3443)